MTDVAANGSEPSAELDALEFIEAIGFHDTGVRLGPNPDTGRVKAFDNGPDYKDSCGLYAWVNAQTGDVVYIGATESCFRARMKGHAQQGAAQGWLAHDGSTVEVWFLEEPERHFTQMILSPRKGPAIAIPRPDLLLLERFLISYARERGPEHGWNLFNAK